MVKYQSPRDVDRYMVGYRMRTQYGTPTKLNRSTPNEQNTNSKSRHVAHEQSHSRHNPSEAFYHSEGRIDKNSRIKKTSQQQNNYNRTNASSKTTTTTTVKKSSCCTIL